MSIVSTETSGADVNERPSRTAARRTERALGPGTAAARELAASGALDELFAQIDAGELDLTGDGGFIPALIKATLERGLAAELSGHLGYEKGAPDAASFRNSRNGTTPKTVATQVGDVDLAVPRDRDSSFTPHLVPKGSRRLGGLDEMVIRVRHHKRIIDVRVRQRRIMISPQRRQLQQFTLQIDKRMMTLRHQNAQRLSIQRLSIQRLPVQPPHPVRVHTSNVDVGTDSFRSSARPPGTDAPGWSQHWFGVESFRPAYG